MGWKCLPQLTGLVRGEPKPNAKHRSNGAAICGEAGKERHSASETLDRTRSKYNAYAGYKTGRECWAAMEATAAEYRVEGVSRSGKAFSRKLREDAVIGWAMIFHPPEEVAAEWSREKHKQFVRDSWAAMSKIEPRLFRRENIRMQAIHRDEDVEHFHVVGDAKDAEGRYCGNVVDAALMVRVCKEYPAMMRAKGWDIEDAELTDFSRMGKNADGTYKDPEYRAQVKARKGGRSVNQYAADKARERLDEADRMYQDAGTALQGAQEALQDAQRAADGIIAAAREKAQDEALEARKKELDARERRVSRAEVAAKNVQDTVRELQAAGLLREDGTPKARDELRREFTQQQQQQQGRQQPQRGHEFDGLFG